MYRLISSRSAVVLRNLEICFPELSLAEQKELAVQHFESLGMGIIEHGMAWWCSDAELSRLIEADGVEHIHDALEKGKGVLLLSGHFSTQEFSARGLRPLVPPISAMYRPSKNPLTDQIIRRLRNRSVDALLSKDNVRGLLKALRKNLPVWYAPDQAYSRKGTVLVPFFGEPAVTNTSTSQIAKVSGAPVVPYWPVRVANGKSYRLVILPALADFPGESLEDDAKRINLLLEERIRMHPEQYYWVHRRFKNRPDGLPDPY